MMLGYLLTHNADGHVRAGAVGQNRRNRHIVGIVADVGRAGFPCCFIR